MGGIKPMFDKEEEKRRRYGILPENYVPPSQRGRVPGTAAVQGALQGQGFLPPEYRPPSVRGDATATPMTAAATPSGVPDVVLPTDTRTGAPMQVRAAIARLRTPEEKIRVASQMLGTEVRETPEGLAYLNPSSGEWTRVDEGGMPTRRDVVESAPTIGAMAGGAAGMAFGPAASIGLGTAGQLAGEYGLRRAEARATGQPPAPITLGQGLMALGENVLGEAAGMGAGRVFGRVQPGAARTVARAAQSEATGIPQTLGQALNSQAMMGAEAGFAGLPGGTSIGRTMGGRQVAAGEQALTGATERIAGGSVPKVGDIGATARGIASRRANEVFGEASRVYGEVANEIRSYLPGGRIPRLNHVAEYRAELVRMLAETPTPKDRAPIAAALEEADDILAGAANGGFDPAQLSKTRMRISRQADFSTPFEAPNTQTEARGYLRELYGKIDEDFKEYAEVAGGGTLQKYERAKDLVRQFRDAGMPGGMENLGAGASLWQRVQNADDPRAAFDQLFGMDKIVENPRYITSLRRQMAPGEWNQFTGRLLRRMGEATPGARSGLDPATGLVADRADDEVSFSIASFLTNWNKLRTSDRRALFGGALPEVEEMVQVLERVKQGERMLNTSKTAHGVLLGSASTEAIKSMAGRAGAAGSVGLGAALIAGLGPIGAAAGSIAMVVAVPNLFMRFSTSPTVMKSAVAISKALANPMTPRIANQVSSQIGRMLTASKGNPELAAAVDEYVTRLRAAGITDVPTVEF